MIVHWFRLRSFILEHIPSKKSGQPLFWHAFWKVPLGERKMIQRFVRACFFFFQCELHFCYSSLWIVHENFKYQIGIHFFPVISVPVTVQFVFLQIISFSYLLLVISVCCEIYYLYYNSHIIPKEVMYDLYYNSHIALKKLNGESRKIKLHVLHDWYFYIHGQGVIDLGGDFFFFPLLSSFIWNSSFLYFLEFQIYRFIKLYMDF